MGTAKALLPWDHGQPLVCAWCAALAPHCRSLYVVVGGHAEQVRSALPAIASPVHNAAWAHTGLRESLSLAVRHARAAHSSAPELRALVTPVDVPPPPAAVLRALIETGGAAVPRWQGQDGHPVVAPLDRLEQGLALGTLRDLLAGAPRVDVDAPAVCANLNRPQDLTAWREGRC